MIRNPNKEEFGKRLQLVLQELNIKNQRQFALAIKADTTYFSKAYNGKIILSDHYLNIIEQKLGVSKKWLLYGDGNMIIEEKHIDDSLIETTASKNSMAVPLLHIYAQRGYLEIRADSKYLSKLEKITLPKETEKGTYIIIEVSGSSMNDTTAKSILDGDKVLVREIDKDIWMSKSLKRSDVFYAMATADEGLIIKEVIQHNTSKGILTCHSLNPLYKDFDLSINKIYKIFLVLKIVERKLLK